MLSRRRRGSGADPAAGADPVSSVDPATAVDPARPRRRSRRASARRGRLRRVLGAVLCALAGIPAALAIAPAAGQVPFALSVLLPTLAPFLVPTALLGALLTLSGMLAGRRPRAGAAERIRDLSALALAVLGAVVPGAAYGAVVVTAQRAGAAVDVIRTLAPRSMAAAPERTIPARDDSHGRLQIWAPPGGAQDAPILFDVHGGGWNTDAQMQATLRALAQRGWLVVRPEYPLASPGHPTWQEAPRSLARSYAWVARHAGQLGGDPRRISMFGDSADGGLAVNLADRIAAGTLDGIDDAALPVPRAVVALYPTVDVAAVQRVRALGAGKAAEEFVGGTPEEHPERYRTLDARTWAARSDPPTLIIRGGADTFVPPDSVRDFVAAARAGGAAVTDLRVPLADHAFDAQARDSAGYQLVTGAAARFLAEHG